MDRRKRKSQEAIRNALISLLNYKDIEKITINEIAQKADVSRGTIYLNYADKYELLNDCINMCTNNLLSNCAHTSDSDISSREIIFKSFKHLEENSTSLKLLLKSQGISSFRDILFKVISRFIAEQIAEPEGNAIQINSMSVQYLSSAIVGVLVWWVTHDTGISALAISEDLWDLLIKSQLLQPSQKLHGSKKI